MCVTQVIYVSLTTVLLQNRLEHSKTENLKKFILPYFALYKHILIWTLFKNYKSYSIWLSKAYPVLTFIQHRNISSIYLKQFTGSFNMRFYSLILLLYTFLTNVVTLKLNVYRVSYAHEITHYLGLSLSAHCLIKKCITYSY